MANSVRVHQCGVGFERVGPLPRAGNPAFLHGTPSASVVMTGEDVGVIAGDDVDAEIVSLLDDEYARAVLVYTYDRTRAAEDLTERLDVAPSTIYDRLSRLVEHDLLVEQQRIDPDGHHHKVYRARLDRVVVDLTGDGIEINAEREPIDPADRLTDAFDSLRR